MNELPGKKEMLSQIKDRFARHFLDILVLTIVQNRPAWGYRLISQIRRDYGGKIGCGKMFPLLNSMEERGLTKSRIETKKGRKRKIYETTPKGRELIKAYNEFLKDQLQISGVKLPASGGFGITEEERERLEETRFLILVSMLKEYPELKARIEEWLREKL